MTIQQAVAYGIKKLALKSTSAILDSEVLLCFVLQQTKAHLFAHPEQILTQAQSKEYVRLIGRRSKRMPIAYLTGTKEFGGLDFAVNKYVLIPRPETELLAEKIVEKSANKKNLKILDIGTGSGAIIVYLAKHLGSKHEYFASDVSTKALEMAKLNAQAHRTEITFKHSSLLKKWNEKFDIIAANLPYLAEKTLSTKFEPKLALVARNKGLHLIKNLIMEIKNLPQKPGLIFLEMNYDQKLRIKKLAEQYLPEYKFKCFSDYQRHDRFIMLTKSRSSQA